MRIHRIDVIENHITETACVTIGGMSDFNMSGELGRVSKVDATITL